MALPRGQTARGVPRRAPSLRGPLPRALSRRARARRAADGSRRRHRHPARPGGGLSPIPMSLPTVSTPSCSTVCAATQLPERRLLPTSCFAPAWRGMLAAMKRAVLIVNPFATRVTDEAIAAVERSLMRVAYVRTVRTEGPRHAVELAREAGDSDAVIVFSGDGGFNEALNGIDRNDLPLG